MAKDDNTAEYSMVGAIPGKKPVMGPPVKGQPDYQAARRFFTQTVPDAVRSLGQPSKLGPGGSIYGGGTRDSGFRAAQDVGVPRTAPVAAPPVAAAPVPETAVGMAGAGSFRGAQSVDPRLTVVGATPYAMSERAVADARRDAPAALRGSGSPAGKEVGLRVQSPAYTQYLKGNQQPSRFITTYDERGNPSVTQRGGGYGTGKTPLTAQYDRAGEAALVQARRDAAAAFINTNNQNRALGREKRALMRDANTRVDLNQGLSQYFSNVVKRRNAQEGLKSLRERELQGDKDVASMDRQKQSDASAFQRTALQEQGDDRRTLFQEQQKNQRATAEEAGRNQRDLLDLGYKYDKLGIDTSVNMAELNLKAKDFERKLSKDQFDMFDTLKTDLGITIPDLYAGNAMLNKGVNVALSKADQAMGGQGGQAIPANLEEQTPEQMMFMAQVTSELLRRRKANESFFSLGEDTDLDSIVASIMSQGGPFGRGNRPPLKAR